MQNLGCNGKNRKIWMLCMAIFMCFSLAFMSKVGVAETTNDLERVCVGNKCSLTFQSCMNVLEDGKYIKFADARSLKGKVCGGSWKITHSDGFKYEVNIQDWNSESISLQWFNVWEVPITIYSKNESSNIDYADSKEGVEKGVIIEKTKTKYYNLFLGSTIPIQIGDIIKIGDNSTYVEYQPPPTVTVDTYMAESFPMKNYGVNTAVDVGETDSNRRMMIKIPYVAMGLDPANVTSIDSAIIGVRTVNVGTINIALLQ